MKHKYVVYLGVRTFGDTTTGTLIGGTPGYTWYTYHYSADCKLLVKSFQFLRSRSKKLGLDQKKKTKNKKKQKKNGQRTTVTNH